MCFLVTLNALLPVSFVWSHVHVLIVSTNRYMKIQCLQLGSRLNLTTLLQLLLKSLKPLILCERMNWATLQLLCDIKKDAIAIKTGCLNKCCECYQAGIVWKGLSRLEWFTWLQRLLGLMSIWTIGWTFERVLLCCHSHLLPLVWTKI